MTESFPGFLKVKTGFDGLDVYQRKLGKLNSSWIAFGGEKNDTNIFCAVFWTTSGKKIKELEPWVKRLAGDIPKDGFLHLQSAELIGDDITGKSWPRKFGQSNPVYKWNVATGLSCLG